MNIGDGGDEEGSGTYQQGCACQGSQPKIFPEGY